MKIITTLLILCLSQVWQSSFAQSNNQATKQISGKVTDGYGKPIPGATIVVKGTTKGTVSDDEGKYKIEVLEGDQTLVVSFVGFASIEKNVDNDIPILNFSLGTETIELFGWCCTDHPQPEGPHCGDSQLKLTAKFNCKKFKRDN
ncbi:MAG: carboxypeptidase-like regulatory domain-containing protein [Cyclobacteriaceae bacterium]|nr:carboxypeptidase-like regulatory domain-containing protein [Cyclobacteriaceae bacterium]